MVLFIDVLLKVLNFGQNNRTECEGELIQNKIEVTYRKSWVERDNILHDPRVASTTKPSEH